MQCSYCHAWEQRDSSDKFVSLEKIEEGLQIISDLVGEYDNFYVHFNGDDIFLDWDNTIKPFIERNYKDKIISVHSNGVLLFPERMDFLKQHNVRILLSLDGPQEVQDINRCFKNGKSSFDFVYSRLQALKEKENKMTVVATFDKNSIEYLPFSYSFLMNEQVSFQFLFDTKFSKYNFDDLTKLFKIIAKDFAKRSKEERDRFRSFYRAIHPNDSAYQFALNLHSISLTFNKHTFKAFIHFNDNGFYWVDEMRGIHLAPYKKAKCACNKDELCKKCPAFVPEAIYPPKYNMEIYCLMLREIFAELEVNNVRID